MSLTYSPSVPVPQLDYSGLTPCRIRPSWFGRLSRRLVPVMKRRMSRRTVDDSLQISRHQADRFRLHTFQYL
jgi:hypothetical protein